MTEIIIERKHRLKKSATLSMHVDRETLERFRSKCVDEFGMVHTDVIRDFIGRVVTGEIKLNVKNR